MKRFEIEINPENCTGCLRCQLTCSYLYTDSFNPSAARILFAASGSVSDLASDLASELASELDISIAFTDECTKCAICADDCLFGALVKKKQTENIDGGVL